MSSDPEDGIEATTGILSANPLIPCHGCGIEERFLEMKRDPEWTLEYVDEPRWVAHCPECDPRE